MCFYIGSFIKYQVSIWEFFFILSIYHQVAELKSPLGGANELSGQAKEVQVVWQEVGFTSCVVRYSFINRIVYIVEVVWILMLYLKKGETVSKSIHMLTIIVNYS